LQVCAARAYFAAQTFRQANGRGYANYGVGKKVRIVTDDPVFVVVVSKYKATVKVVSGSVLVSGQGGASKAVVVGPQQQVAVRRGRDPDAVVPIELTPNELADSGKLKEKPPNADFSRPDPAGSPTLQRIFQRGALSVGLDTMTRLGPATSGFSDAFWRFLANSWKLSFTGLTFVTGPSGDKALASGTLDAVVTPSPTAFDFDHVPFFADAQRATWYLEIPVDKSYRSALSRFLVTAVITGRYASILSRGVWQGSVVYASSSNSLSQRLELSWVSHARAHIRLVESGQMHRSLLFAEGHPAERSQYRLFRLQQSFFRDRRRSRRRASRSTR
jgi:hypothetical protein